MRKISVLGLGYVGLPVAIAFSEQQKVIGFDVNKKRISELEEGFDRNLEVSKNELRSANIKFTDNIDELKEANFHIVTVPTPITSANKPDLSIIRAACDTLGNILKKGDIIVFESTVYPGVTEDECVPILESVSGLTYKKDFHVGYSPERINPGDKKHTFTKIKKVVSGSDQVTLNEISKTYSSVVSAGVFEAASIKVAEAAKIIENTQRDINIAFMNELSIIFDKLDINTADVLEAASTKWNFLNFYPGLVGGHCIGVDPYYLTYKAESLGYNSQVILSGRRINDEMGKYIAQKTIKELIKNKHDVSNSIVTILGLTFKENTPDIRNSKIVDIIEELQSFGVTVQIHDPLAMEDDALREYGLKLVQFKDLEKSDCVVLAVNHREFQDLNVESILDLTGNNPNALIVGIRSHIPQQRFQDQNIKTWYL